MKRTCLALSICLLLSACHSGIEGTYGDEIGVTEYTFKSGDKVAVNTMGMETEQEYSVEGNEVKIGSPMGKMVFKFNEDGSLAGPMGLKLVKKTK